MDIILELLEKGLSLVKTAFWIIVALCVVVIGYIFF